MLKVGEAIKISTGSIKNAKLRSGLTALGIIIGIAAVVANFSLGESFNVYFTDEINAQGSNFIIIYSQEPNLFYSDQLEVIKQTAGISAVSPIKQQLGEVRYFSQVKNIEIIGVTEDYQDTSNVTMAKGSFINDRDTFSAVVGAEVANGKFNRNISTRSTLDITFRLKNNNSVTKSFKVKGIIQSPEVAVVGEGNIDRDVSIFIPITTMNQMLNQSDYSAFVAMADSIEGVETASDEVDKRLARNFGVSSRDLEDEDAKPYRILNQVDILEQTNQISNTLRNFLVSVALISLLVGSIGIMNIMLVTVTERTREIGIMKALGYSSLDVLLLFLIESIILSFFGGVLGLMLGLAGAYAASVFLDIPFLYPYYILGVGLVVSVFVGVTAGIYPANKAAKMEPVTALRHN